MARKPRRRRPAVHVDPSSVEGVVIGAIRLGHTLTSLLDKLLQPYGITLLQFNALRILYVRDPEFAGIPSGTIGARLLARVPDVPRLIDRLARSELVERSASPDDRRVVLVRLTQKGVDLLEETFEVVLAHNRRLLADMSTPELVELAEGLRRAHEVVARQGGADPE